MNIFEKWLIYRKEDINPISFKAFLYAYGTLEEWQYYTPKINKLLEDQTKLNSY